MIISKHNTQKVFIDCSCIEANNNAANFTYVRDKIEGIDFGQLYGNEDKVYKISKISLLAIVTFDGVFI